ncbi:MAG: GGDEF domain-containing protein [Oscillospiraceae bacterium]|nr:GGDEF domain-containing protein [Oscillospiraceae bacterium]
MDDCLAVNLQDSLLYSILSKINGIVSPSTISASLTKYYAEDAKTTVVDLFRRNLVVLLGVFALLGGVFLFLLLRGKRAEKRADENRRLISETEIDKRTGLYNREYFYAYAERMYREKPDQAMDAVVMSVDQLSAVAVMCGQRFEDDILHTLGTGLQSFVKEHCGIAGRTDTNRFAVFCPPVEDYDRLYRSLQGSLDILSPDMSLRLKMGVAPWRADTKPVRMLELARMACRRARRMGEERIIVVDEKLLEREAYDKRLLLDLKRAVEDMEFEVYYQPKFDIRGETPKLVGAEALVRWRHPELGLIESGDFVQLLERSGEIGTVDQYVWKQTIRQIVAWKEKYGATLPASVNLSSQDLFDPALKRTLGEAIRENEISYGDLKLEIRESVCAENKFQIFEIVENLRRAGYEIQIDNFGSENGALSVLSSIAVDGLKLDRSAIFEMEQDEKASRLVDLILETAGYLKLPVIAVGVETESQLRLLKKKGCAFAQGYYFSRPLPVQEFEARFLRRT